MFVNNMTDDRVVMTNMLGIPASRMPMICHRYAFESCGGPILHPEQKN
jgi:hypothetical protein